MARAVHGKNLTGRKVCSRCKEAKVYDDFHLRGNREHGRVSWCKACESLRNASRSVEYKKRQYEKHREKYLVKYREKNYGITGEQYNEMVERQNGLCAVCGHPETSKNKRQEIKQLAVDHDHETGHVRGLLCAACNCALGYMRDNPARLRAAADYLESGGSHGGV